jgi:hypothetical protein
MNILNLKTVILSLFVLSSGAALAESNKNAEALSKAMLPEAQFKQMSDAIVQTGLGAAQAKVESEKLAIDMDKKGKDLEKSLRSAFTYEYFIALNSKTMMKNFSDDELGKILGFYNTPVGKKWTKHTPEIISETMTQIQMDLQEKLPKLVDAMIAKK